MHKASIKGAAAGHVRSMGFKAATYRLLILLGISANVEDSLGQEWSTRREDSVKADQ